MALMPGALGSDRVQPAQRFDSEVSVSCQCQYESHVVPGCRGHCCHQKHFHKSYLVDLQSREIINGGNL